MSDVPEIDWGDHAPKARNWESEAAKRARHASDILEMEARRALILTARKRTLAKISLLIFISIGAGAYWYFSLSTAHPPSVSAPLLAIEQPIAAPVPVPVPMPEVKSQSKPKLDRLIEGVRVLTEDQEELSRRIIGNDRFLLGTYTTDPATRNGDGLVQKLRAAKDQLARMSPGDSKYWDQRKHTETLQAQINDTTREMAHDREVLGGVNARLAKAKADLLAAQNNILK